MIMDGYLPSCKGSLCEVSCCSRGYGQRVEEFNNSFLGKNADRLKALGITSHNINNLIYLKGCSDGKNCRILEELCDKEDVRSLACKIFPYTSWKVMSSDLSKETIGICLHDCPATQPKYSVPEEFTEFAKRIVKRHHKEMYNKDVDVIIINKPQEC